MKKEEKKQIAWDGAKIKIFSLLLQSAKCKICITECFKQFCLIEVKLLVQTLDVLMNKSQLNGKFPAKKNQ